MPELPEVETICRGLRRTVCGRKIRDVLVFDAKVLCQPRLEFVRNLKGRTIKNIRRLGKYLILDLDQGHLLVHLKLTGQLVFCRKKGTGCFSCQSPEKPRVDFIFSDYTRLSYCDLRKFGRLKFFRKDPGPGLVLGPEPQAETFSLDYLQGLGRRRKKSRIKDLLLDQKVIAGLGNIYVVEALFKAGISPFRPAGSLKKLEWVRLRQAVNDIMRKAIKYQGTTVISYRDSTGKEGAFQKFLRVYDREGEPCVICGRSVRRKKTGSRSTYYCPSCQR